MLNEKYHASDIRKLLKRSKIADISELKRALGTSVDVTVFRKLQELACRTSYSHRGRFYALDDVIAFDVLGLWSFRDVWFSRFGTLLSTAEALVQGSEAGFFADELESVVHVGVQDALRTLAQSNRICREKLNGRYLYLSRDAFAKRDQMTARQIQDARPSSLGHGVSFRVLPDELRAAIILFYSLLDERQRRLYAGLESLKVGHGGDQRVADLLGLDLKTIAKGRQQLLEQDVEVDRVRNAGGGRKATEKKRRK